MGKFTLSESSDFKRFQVAIQIHPCWLCVSLARMGATVASLKDLCGFNQLFWLIKFDNYTTIELYIKALSVQEY